MTWASNDDRELLALRELSAALGADPLRTQGAGGNISVKRDGILWIKASGTWLADALAHDIMTPVRLDPLREAIAQRDPRAAAAVDFVDSDLNASGLRPSIETSVHAVIPSPVVVHIHCVNTIALAVRRDGEALVRERLGGQADVVCAFVPYRKPGLPLAIAVSERSTADTNVLFSPIMDSSSPAGRLPKSPTAPRAYARRFPRRRARRLSLTSRRFPRSLRAPNIGCRKLQPRTPSRSIRKAWRSQAADRSIPTTWSFSGPASSRRRLVWRAPSSARQSPASSNAGLARSRNCASSFSDEERGRDGAMSCGCCGSHPRGRPDDRPDRRRGARIDELGSRDLPTVDRQMSLRPDARMRYWN